MMVAEAQAVNAYSTGRRALGSNIIINGAPLPLLELGERKIFAFLTKFPNGSFEEYQNTMHYRVTEDLFHKVRTEMQHSHQIPPTPAPGTNTATKNSGTQIALQNLARSFNRKPRTHTAPEKKLEVIKWIRANPQGKYVDMQAQLDIPTMKLGNFYNLRSEYLHNDRKQAKTINPKKEPITMPSNSDFASKKTPYDIDPRVKPVAIPYLYNLPTLKLNDLRALTFEGYKTLFPDHKDAKPSHFHSWKGKDIHRRGAKSNTEIGFELSGNGTISSKSVKTKTLGRPRKQQKPMNEEPILTPVGSVFYSIPCSSMSPETKLELKKILPNIMETLHPHGGPFKCLEFVDDEPMIQIQKG